MTPPVATTSEKQARAIQALDYEFPQIIRYFQNTLGMDEATAELLWEDTKKFMYLLAMNRGEKLSPNEAMDDGWHGFLVHTREYEDFCEKYFRQYIHHRPHNPFEPRDPGPSGTILLRKLAEEAFGEPLSSNWDIPQWAILKERRRKLLAEGALASIDPCSGCDTCDGCGCDGGSCDFDGCDGCD